MQLFSKIYAFFSLLILGAVAVGCSDAIEVPEMPLEAGAPGTITINFRNTRMSRSAASDNSENKIGKLMVCLYDDPLDDDAAPVYRREFIPNGYNATTVVMQLTDELVEKLFPAGGNNECRMYAVANYVDLPEVLTVNNIKSHIVTAAFDASALQESFVMAGEGLVKYTPSDNPAEKGKAEGKGNLIRTAAKINLNISLPDKIEIFDEDSVVIETWFPQTSNDAIHVLLTNGVNSAPIVPSAGWEPADDEAYYNSVETKKESYRILNAAAGAEGDYPYQMGVPFYTYPNAWTENIEENHKTMLMLMVPWRKDGTDTYNILYYQVPVVPGTLFEITSNYSYNINMKVGMLGSPNPETPIELENLSYQIVDWAAEDIDVTISDYRYLVVNPNYYVANNESQIVIPFYTSHPVEINDIEMTYQRFNFYSDGNGDVVEIPITKAQIDRSVTGTDSLCTYHVVKNNTTGQMSIVIDHKLQMWTPVNADGATVQLTGMSGTGNQTLDQVKNNINRYVRPANPEGAYSPYKISVKIRHKDNEAFNSDIDIVQYPAMYIEADRNEGGSYNVVTSAFGFNYAQSQNYGFVFVNPQFQSGTSFGQAYSGWVNDTDFGGVHGLTGNNTNPNMYVITISQLETETQYIIGDPRSNFINNSLSGNNALRPTTNETTTPSWSNPGNVVYPTTNSSKRGLLYYYPTNEVDASSKEAYMIAPKIRVASSWGVCTTGRTREQARRRCATYQEQGFPAGRWRLPTLGEFTYITQLSAAGKIPVLFSPNTNYLTAQGFYSVNNNGVVSAGTGDGASVRAVYDEWYWEQMPQYAMPKNADGGYDYTLGDVPRDFNKN
ncbi:MAG: hypothetical protein K2K55_05800 [Duncaniella sp.]|nr:hypothetical protein [Duncaniella sp.]